MRLFSEPISPSIWGETRPGDQHAADERVRFEKFKRELTAGAISTQGLLIPEPLSLGEEGGERFQAWSEKLASVGFEVDLIADDRAVVRGVPALWGNHRLGPRLANLWARLQGEGPQDRDLAWDEVLFETTAMRACRSAVKAGDVLSAWARP